MSPFWSKGGQSSTTTDHNGHWPLTLDSHTSWLSRYAKLYFFWIILVIQSIWVHFRWNRTNLKIWPPVKKVNDLLLIWPLSQEWNIVWISCNWIFCSLWPKEEFDMHYNLIEACWLFWYHVALPPSCDPPCNWLIYVSTLGVFIRPQWTVGHLQSFYNFTRQVDLTCPWVYPLTLNGWFGIGLPDTHFVDSRFAGLRPNIHYVDSWWVQTRDYEAISTFWCVPIATATCIPSCVVNFISDIFHWQSVDYLQSINIIRSTEEGGK